MENPKIKVKVKHSKSKSAWNIVSTSLGRKYKIARVPYVETKDSEMLTELEKSEALRHAKYIAFCFNNSGLILEVMQLKQV